MRACAPISARIGLADKQMHEAHAFRAMLTDAIETLDVAFTSPLSLYFLRVYSIFSFQAFPAIYFAAFDGVLPLAVSESLWATSDWALKMVMTSSLMEANFMTIEQRRDRTRRRHKERMRMRHILNLTSAIEAKGAASPARSRMHLHTHPCLIATPVRVSRIPALRHGSAVGVRYRRRPPAPVSTTVAKQSAWSPTAVAEQMARHSVATWHCPAWSMRIRRCLSLCLRCACGSPAYIRTMHVHAVAQRISERCMCNGAREASSARGLAAAGSFRAAVERDAAVPASIVRRCAALSLN